MSNAILVFHRFWPIVEKLFYIPSTMFIWWLYQLGLTLKNAKKTLMLFIPLFSFGGSMLKFSFLYENIFEPHVSVIFLAVVLFVFDCILCVIGLKVIESEIVSQNMVDIRIIILQSLAAFYMLIMIFDVPPTLINITDGMFPWNLVYSALPDIMIIVAIVGMGSNGKLQIKEKLHNFVKSDNKNYLTT